MKTLICDCNHTQPLDAPALGAAIGQPLHLHSALCRREADAFVQAARSGAPLLVACTQEARLFAELADHAAGQDQRASAPLHFVNLRETGGWSRDARAATPKLAALLAVAQGPEPEPVPSVRYESAGCLLVIGVRAQAEALLDWLGDGLQASVFALGVGSSGAQQHSVAVLSGHIEHLSGWLGAFELRWRADNPIDLDLCTRCNACLAACPSGAIGLDYQVDLAVCDGARACLRACSAAGAIDFERTAPTHSQHFDLVLDLRDTPAFSQHARPQGYAWAPRGADLSAAIAQLRAWVGTFEKPRFVDYQPRLCAHARNARTGCSACVDVCSASALQSDAAHGRIALQAQLCVGCGTCTTVCPSGALRYQLPRPAALGARIQTLLTTYRRCGGRDAALLLHSQGAGARWLGELGRAAMLGRAQADGLHGVPARVLPLALWHSLSSGIELWLSAIAWGACQVWVLSTQDDAPQYLDALAAQMAQAQAMLSGLGYGTEHLAHVHVRDARDLADLDAALSASAARGVAQPATFGVQDDKRSTLELALAHLAQHAPTVPTAPIALPAAGALMGALQVDAARCTLCMACVGACPAGALQDGRQAPELRLIEKNCVQCGLCARTCPEQAISLLARLNLDPARRDAVLLHSAPPYHCVRCGQPFGTAQGIAAMLARLSGHAMFQGAALDRLKMCADCRVIDLYTAPNEVRITDL